MDLPLTFPCRLPADPLGIGYGSEYFSRIHAGRDSTFTTDYLFYSVKNGREVDCLGMGEKSMARLLEISPFVLAYRCQYPMLLARARERIDRYLAGFGEEKPRITRGDMISLDIVVTARRHILNHSGIVLVQPDYIILSHKLETDLKEKRVKKRLDLERRESNLAGYQHVVFSRTNILDECGKSARQIMLWGKGCDFNVCSKIAKQIGDIFYETYSDEILDGFLMKTSRKLGISIDDSYLYFSAAVHLGYIFVDLSLPVRTRYPLQLISPNEAVPPWISFSGRGNSSMDH